MHVIGAAQLTEHLAKLDVAVVNLGRHYNKHSAGGRNEAAYAQRVHQHAAACVKFGSVPENCKAALMLETLPSHFPDAAGTGEHEEWSKAPRWGKETPAPGENHTSCAYRRERRDWRNVYLHKAMAKPAMAKLPLLAIEDMLAPRWDAHFQNYRPKMDCVHWCNRPSVWEPVLMQLQRAVVGAVVALPSKCDAPLVR